MNLKQIDKDRKVPEKDDTYEKLLDVDGVFSTFLGIAHYHSVNIFSKF